MVQFFSKWIKLFPSNLLFLVQSLYPFNSEDWSRNFLWKYFYPPDCMATHAKIHFERRVAFLCCWPLVRNSFSSFSFQ